MSHLLLKLRDTFTLSYTKFKTRRIRTLLTLISASIMSMILVVASSVLTGFFKIAEGTPQTALTDMHLAEVFIFDGAPRLEGSPESLQKVTQRFHDTYKNATGIENVYLEGRLSGDEIAYARPELDLLKPPTNNRSRQFDVYGPDETTARSEALLRPFVEEGQSLQWSEGQPLPIIVSSESLANVYESELSKLKEAEKRVERRLQIQRDLIGKTGTLELKEYTFAAPLTPSGPDTPDASFEKTTIGEPELKTLKTIPVKVVGFSPSSAEFLEDGYSVRGYAMPIEAAMQSTHTRDLFKEVTTFYPSFDSTKNRNAFASANKDTADIYADIVESNKQYFKTFDKIYRIAVIVMLVLMAIPMAATLSKILADSQRETGVFRAIGARNRNILGIYTIYSLLVVLSAFVLSLITGYTLAGVIDAKWADDVELGIADLGNTVVNVSFVRMNVEHLAIILAGMIGGSALGAAFPMFRSLRRDPIKSLRDE